MNKNRIYKIDVYIYGNKNKTIIKEIIINSIWNKKHDYNIINMKLL